MDLPASPLIAPLNHVLSRNAWARERLRPHCGAVVTLNIDSVSLGLEIDEAGLFRGNDRSGDVPPPDVTITIPLSAIPRLAFDDQQNGMGAVRLEGNAELADTVSFVLRHLEWDPEADLATVMGDIAAHRVVSGLRRLAPLPRRAAASFAGNMRDYLVEERPVLVARAAIAQVDQDVRALRDDIARLEKRIARMPLMAGAAAPRTRR